MYPRFILSCLGALVVLCVTPIATLACRSPVTLSQTTQAQTTKPSIANPIANWEGKYNFIEQVEDDGPTLYMNYDLRISLARCGWRSFLTVNGHLTSLDLQTDVRAIDANTIGLYYQQDIVPPLQTPQFQPGQLLLRIHREIPAPSKPHWKFPKPTVPIYRVYFEALTPLTPSHQTNGLEIAPPQSIHK
jgi:Family of unknown function (DUF5991)